MTGFENIKKNLGFGCMRLPIVLGGCRSYFARNKLCHNLCSIFPDACGGTLAVYGGGAFSGLSLKKLPKSRCLL